MKRLMVLFALAAGSAFSAELTPSKSGSVWTFDATGDDTFSGSLSEATEVIKNGTGTLSLTGDNSGFSGSFTVKKGTLTATALAGFGSPSAVVVEAGATLMTPENSDNGFSTTDATLAGTGVGGNGALYIRCANNKNFFKSLTLSGDATVTLTQKGNFTGGTCTLNGYMLSVKGGATWNINGVTFKASDPADDSRHAAISVVGGTFQIMNNAAFVGDAAKNKIILDGTGVAFYNDKTPVAWGLDMSNTVKFSPSTGLVNNWAGPVVAHGDFKIAGSSEAKLTFSGSVSSTKTVTNYGSHDTTTQAPNTNVFSGVLTLKGGVNVGGGAIVLNGSGEHYLGNSTVSDLNGMGTASYHIGSLQLLGLGSVTNTPTFTLNSHAYATPVELIVGGTEFPRGGDVLMNPNPGGATVLDIREGAVLARNVYMGGSSVNTTETKPGIGTNAQNAVYFRGGSLATRLGGGTFNLYMSEDPDSFGYWGMTGGTMSSYMFNMGAGTEGVGGPSVLHLKGGSLTTPAVTMCRGGRDSVFYQKGGSMTCSGYFYSDTTEGDFSSADGESLVAFSGSGTFAEFNSKIRCAATQAMTSTFAVNSGATLKLMAIEYYGADATAAHDFHFAANGGVLVKKRGDMSFFSMTANDAARTATYTLYENGLTINVESNVCLNSTGTAHQPASLSNGFSNPSGKGILSIALPEDAAFASEKYLGPPVVRITDATGKGAAAVAEFDETTRQVTGITVVAAGFGFSDTPTVRILSADRKSSYVCAATVGACAGAGGLTKTGDGVLNFGNNCVNSYAGPTRILGGTLSFGVNSFPNNSSFEIAQGAVLSLTGSGSGVRYLSTASLAGSGTIVAGSTTAGAAGPRQLKVTERLTLTAGAPLVTDGEITWKNPIVLKVSNPSDLGDSLDFVPLLRADAGVTGTRANVTLENLDPTQWRVVIRGNQLGVRRSGGLLMIFR